MFRVGDKVAFYNAYERDLPEITTVSKITPTGRIRIEKHPYYQFDSNGNQMGGDGWHRSNIVPLTPELYEEIKKNNTIRKAVIMCNKVREKDLDYETAKKLIELLDKKGK